MRVLVVIVLLCAAVMGHAQNGIPANVKLKDGRTVDVQIKSRTTTALVTSIGKIYLTDITSVALPDNDPEYKNMIAALKASGSTVTFDYAPMPVQSPIQQQQVTYDISSLQTSLDGFRRQRTTAKTMQLLGILAIGTSLILAQNDKPDLELIKGLTIGGSAISGLGFIVDMDAGKHLRQ